MNAKISQKHSNILWKAFPYEWKLNLEHLEQSSSDCSKCAQCESPLYLHLVQLQRYLGVFVHIRDFLRSLKMYDFISLTYGLSTVHEGALLHSV